MADESTAQVINAGLDPLAQDPKSTTDYSKEVTELLEKVDNWVKSNRITEAVEEILVLEKKCRMASDAFSCSKLICKVVSVYYEKKDMEKVHEYLTILTRKRSQLKRAISDIVQLTMSWLPALDDKQKIALIKTLCDITDGKIFVEVERARLTKLLAEKKEAEGDIEAAADLIQEAQVETFGAMERREKAEFILNQMRLVILRKDFIRAQIVSKKINAKLLEAEDFQDIKLEYYQHMIRFYLHEQNFLDVSKCFQHMFNTKSIQEDEKKWSPLLESMATYLLLAQYDNEQEDLLNKLSTTEKKKLASLPMCEKLVKNFLRRELIEWPLPDEKEVRALSAFQESPHQGAEARWVIFRQRVVQKNIRVIASYYSTTRMSHMAKLLHLTEEETENELTELVSSKFLFAKIDRPAGTILFGEQIHPADDLNKWGHSIVSALDLVEESCHRIQKEHMIHTARAKAK